MESRSKGCQFFSSGGGDWSSAPGPRGPVGLHHPPKHQRPYWVPGIIILSWISHNPPKNSFPRPWGGTPSVGYCVSSPMRMMLMVYAWGHFLFETQRQSCVSGAIEPEWMLRDLFIDFWLFSIPLCSPWQPWLLLSSEPGWVAGIHFVALCVLHCLPSAYCKWTHNVNFCVLLFWHGSLAPTLKWEMDVTYMFRTAWGFENN